jgi:AdoMet-dependent heme synthase
LAAISVVTQPAEAIDSRKCSVARRPGASECNRRAEAKRLKDEWCALIASPHPALCTAALRERVEIAHSGAQPEVSAQRPRGRLSPRRTRGEQELADSKIASICPTESCAARALLRSNRMFAGAVHDYEDRPFIAIWEMTQACDLVCLHCRACARPERDPGELTTEEGRRLLDRFAAVNVPLVVLTGGDPATRPDLVELVAHGRTRGLHVGLTPSATPRVTRTLIRDLAGAGLSRLAVSIDGSDAATHEAFRGVAGSYAHSLRILGDARDSALATQINTTVHQGSLGQLGAIAELVKELGSVLWSVFYIVPTGRAQARMMPSAERVEATLHELAEIAVHAPFTVKTTAAPHYRRVVLERRKAGNGAVSRGLAREASRVNDGRGFLFISHRGEIYPSGFLPLSCGNVRSTDPIHTYRNHPNFRTLRDASALRGKCGVCEYREICGGSRARAYALTGSMLASDPLCAYVPPRCADPGHRRHVLGG